MRSAPFVTNGNGRDHTSNVQHGWRIADSQRAAGSHCMLVVGFAICVGGQPTSLSLCCADPRLSAAAPATCEDKKKERLSPRTAASTGQCNTFRRYLSQTTAGMQEVEQRREQLPRRKGAEIGPEIEFACFDSACSASPREHSHPSY
jgi:hypothetical protein